MHDFLQRAAGTRLMGDAYGTDFQRNFWRIGESGFWKLERRQTFRQPGSESWVAFDNGEWERALRLQQARRAEITEYYEKIAMHGFKTWWVRVVEKPITPYLQWELHSLRLRSQCGDRIRVVPAQQLARFEIDDKVPELITLGADLMYELLYDHNGLHEGAIRYTGAKVVQGCREIISDLYAIGEDLEDFFEREVSGLEPPREQVTHVRRQAG
jgi:hypothetical protein